MDIGSYQVIGSLFDKYISYGQARSMQNDMNEYNSPVQQIARMRQAGLSPWNYTGDGNTAAQPVMSDSKLGESLGSVADRSIAKHQVEAQIKLAEAQAKQTESLTKTNDTLLKYLDESEQERIKNTKANTENLIQSSGLLGSQKSETDKRVSRYDEQVDATIQQQKAAATLQYANSKLAVAETKRINRLISWEVKEAKQRIELSKEQVAVLKTQGKLNNKQISSLGVVMAKNRAEIQKIGAETWAQKHSNIIWQKCGVKPGTPAWTAVVDVLGSNVTYNLPDW